MDDLKDSSFFLVGNIPAFFRSANLRTYFSQFVEKKYFTCFHYRHRPEQLRRKSGLKKQQSASDRDDSKVSTSSLCEEDNKGDTASTKCCVVVVGSEGTGRNFVRMYHKKNWALTDGTMLPGIVHITRLNVRINPSLPTEMKSGKTTCYMLSPALLMIPYLT